VSALVGRVSACFDDVSAWTKSNRLQLNPLKTEVSWCSPVRCQRQTPTSSLRVGGASITPASTARDPGVHLNSDVTMTSHVIAAVRVCFAVLRQIQSVQHPLSRDMLVTLLRALVSGRVDYCNSVLVGASRTLLTRLRSVINTAARLMFSPRRSQPVASLDSLLRELQWLRFRNGSSFVSASWDNGTCTSRRRRSLPTACI
jgi:hypothetical protein